MPNKKTPSRSATGTKVTPKGISPKTLTAATARRVRGGQGDPKKGGLGGSGGGKGI